MSDNVVVTAGVGTTVAADEVTEGTLGTVKVQYVKLMDGTIDGTAKATVNSNGLTVDPSGVTSPVSASSLPLPTGASTSAKQDTGNTSLASIDGKITAVNTGAVTISSSALPTGAATAAKQPAIGTAGTASADVITVQGKASMTPVLIDGSATTQPISGTVTVTGVSTASNQATGNISLGNIDTSTAASKTDLDTIAGAVSSSKVNVNISSGNITGFATSTKQSDGSQKTQLVDGSGNVIGSTSNALDINIKSGASSGTQYADGAVRGTATGTLMMVDDGTDIQSAAGTTGGVLKVDLSSTTANSTAVKTDSSATTQPVSGTFWQATQPVSGTVTANAGTNLNTSALALETGGNLAAIKADVDKIPSQGQALAAASTPVVLTAAQVTTLTPPAAITNYANETGGNLAASKTDLDTLAGAVTSAKMQVNVTNASIPVTGTFFQATQPVSLATNTPTLQSGSTTAVTQATAANLNATVVGTGTFAVQSSGGTASGSSLTANPLTAGGLGKTANPTAITDGQVVNSLHDKLGKQVVVGSIRDLKGNQFTTITASTSETTVVTAVASTFLDVYGVIVENTSATASKVTFKDSTTGTTQFEIYVPAGDTRGFMLNESAAFKQTTVNNNWTATCGTSVSSIVISMLYVKNI